MGSLKTVLVCFMGKVLVFLIPQKGPAPYKKACAPLSLGHTPSVFSFLLAGQVPKGLGGGTTEVTHSFHRVGAYGCFTGEHQGSGAV